MIIKNYKTIKTILLILLIMLTFIVVFNKFNKQKSYLDSPVGSIELVDKNTIQSIDLINQRVNRLQSFSCDNIKIKILNRITFKLNGELYYQKRLNFRLFVWSILAKELDIGSNNSHFWFWSNRMKPSVLYYSHHSNIKNTRLKTPFNPIWIKGSLGLDPIIVQANDSYRYRGNYIEIIQQMPSHNQYDVIRSVLVDLKSNLIIGQYLYENNVLIAKSEIIEFQTIGNEILPKQIIIEWVQENIQMKWSLINPKVNHSVDKKYWSLPNISPSINMGLSIDL